MLYLPNQCIKVAVCNYISSILLISYFNSCNSFLKCNHVAFNTLIILHISIENHLWHNDCANSANYVTLFLVIDQRKNPVTLPEDKSRIISPAKFFPRSFHGNLFLSLTQVRCWMHILCKGAKLMVMHYLCSV